MTASPIRRMGNSVGWLAASLAELNYRLRAGAQFSYVSRSLLADVGSAICGAWCAPSEARLLLQLAQEVLE